MKDIVSLKERDPKEYKKIVDEANTPKPISNEEIIKIGKLIAEATSKNYCEGCEGIEPIQEMVLIERTKGKVIEGKTNNSLLPNVKVHPIPSVRLIAETYKCPRCGRKKTDDFSVHPDTKIEEV